MVHPGFEAFDPPQEVPVESHHINLANARTDEQREVMQAIAEYGKCPFCAEGLEMFHKKPIVRTGENWLLTENQWPYPNTVTHMLAIAAFHVGSIHELPEGAGEELFDHMRWASKEYGIAAGGIAMRFGDTSLTGGTVTHLHAHLIEPEPNLPKEDKVRFKIS